MTNMARRLRQLANEIDARRTGRSIHVVMDLLRGSGQLREAIAALERARGVGTTVQAGLRALAAAHDHLRVLVCQLEKETWPTLEADRQEPPKGTA